MNIYRKVINGEKTHVYFLGLPIYYENRKENEIRKRFLWIHSIEKIDNVNNAKNNNTIINKISNKVLNKKEIKKIIV